MIKDASFGIIPVYKNINGDYQFLIIDQKTYNGNFIGFPKGHAESGEADIIAARRELFEEVGIKNIDIDENKFASFDYKFEEKGQKYHKTVTYWLGFTDSKNYVVQADELNSCKWVSIDQASKEITHNNMKKIFIKLLDMNNIAIQRLS